MSYVSTGAKITAGAYASYVAYRMMLGGNADDPVQLPPIRARRLGGADHLTGLIEMRRYHSGCEKCHVLPVLPRKNSVFLMRFQIRL